MIRKANPEDAGAIAAFLEGHIETSMFLMGNLEAHGIGKTEHPHGTAFFLRETGDGITGVFGCTNGGFLMCQLPGLTPSEAQTYMHLLKGYTLSGMTGHVEQVTQILDALAVPDEAWRINRVEPLYRIALRDLPPAPKVRAPEMQDVPLLSRWLATYMQETDSVPPGVTPDVLPQVAERRAQAAVGSDRMRVMEEDGNMVGMAGVNAKAGSAVQVGGVFVPAELRGAGRGGRVTAGLLADAAAQGSTTGILFAASEAAASAYEKIGFQKIGGYRIALLNDPRLLTGAA